MCPDVKRTAKPADKKLQFASCNKVMRVAMFEFMRCDFLEVVEEQQRKYKRALPNLVAQHSEAMLA